MPVPKRKQSRSRRDSRSANKGIIAKPFSICLTPFCDSPLLGHTVCRECGIYNGKKVIECSELFRLRLSVSVMKKKGSLEAE
jgi:large subunit ribosomal protein L32